MPKLLAILDVQGLPIHRYRYLVHPKKKKLSPVTPAFLEFAKMEGQNIARKTKQKLEKIRKSRAYKNRKQKNK